jgi:hypothetical protein
MNRIAKMGQYSCSHNAEQAYLMKKMINVVHTAAMKSCGIVPRPYKGVNRKQVKKAFKTLKKMRRPKPEQPSAKTPEASPKTPEPSAPTPEPSVATPEPSVLQPPPVVIKNPCEGAFDGSGVGFEKFEAPGGVREFDG